MTRERRHFGAGASPMGAFVGNRYNACDPCPWFASG
jgi:hypothetical protein